MKTLKRILSLFLALLTVMSVMVVGVGSSAASAATNGVYKYRINDDGMAYLARAYDKDYTGKTFVVPSTIDGYKVKGIYVDDFLDNLRKSGNDDTVTSVRIEEGIVDIDAHSRYNDPEYYKNYGGEPYDVSKAYFSQLKNLKTIYLPSTLKRIAPAMFKDCTSLRSIVIPDSVEEIATNAFDGCTSLEFVKLPANLKKIGAFAFRNCALKDLRLPKSVEFIGDEAFNGCKYISGRLDLPTALKDLGEGAFAFCSGLTAFNLDKNNKYFVQRKGVLFDKSQSKVYAYLTSKKAEEFKVPSTVKYIGAYAFAGAKNLKKLTLSKNTKEIGCYAFMYCRNLKGKFTIPKKVKYIYDGAFAFCNKMTGFKVADGNKYFTQKDGVLFNKKMTKLISYPAGRSGSSYTLPSKVTKLGARAFAGVRKLETVALKAKLTKIPKYAFYKSSVKKVTMNDKITAIERSAFEGCRKLKSIKLAKNLEVINSRAFYGCVSLENITIPKRVYCLYKDVFSECYSLKTVKYLSSKTDNFYGEKWTNCYPTIVAPENSYAEKYAYKWDYEFVAI